jgi:hypothetical protein
MAIQKQQMGAYTIQTEKGHFAYIEQSHVIEEWLPGNYEILPLK